MSKLKRSSAAASFGLQFRGADGGGAEYDLQWKVMIVMVVVLVMVVIVMVMMVMVAPLVLPLMMMLLIMVIFGNDG